MSLTRNFASVTRRVFRDRVVFSGGASSRFASSKCFRVGDAKTRRRENVRVCPALIFLFRKMLHNNFCVQKYVRNYLFCENIFEISRILVLRNNAKRNFAFFLISRNSRNSAKQFLFRIIFVFRENKKIDEIDNPNYRTSRPGVRMERCRRPWSLTSEKTGTRGWRREGRSIKSIFPRCIIQ